MKTVKKNKYEFFTVKELKADGWLKKQLRIQADGLCGNLDKVWPDVRDSAWIGGGSEGWERVPYWLDGFIPLAYLLEDDDMIERAKKYVSSIKSRQSDDGWICPCSEAERGNYDTWAVALITKVLCLYADCSGDESIAGVVEKCLRQFDAHLNYHTLRDWGAARWYETLIAISWLYEKTEADWLITLAKKLRVIGVDWNEVIRTGLLDECTEGWEYYSHVVNIVMMLKSEALWSKFADIDANEFADMALCYLDSRHGMAIGHFGGDECLSGNSPIQGAELCSVVEAMYSFELLFAVTGNVKWLDRLEQLAFNSLPASVGPDMWSHQYVQMINQVTCAPMAAQPFRTNTNDAHIFGLEPNFGCCTANHGQGFPKLALSAFMKSTDGIASCVLVPSVLDTELSGAKVRCELITQYPFRSALKYRITVGNPVEFTFSVRIPAFAKSAYIDGKSVPAGGFAEIKRVWNGESEINVEFDFAAETVKRPENMVCVRRGPLFYSIPIEEKWEKREYNWRIERKFPYCDYFVYPMSKWNYALASDSFKILEYDFETPFNPLTPPIAIETEVVEIPWGYNNGHCDRLPSALTPLGEKEKIKLIPYGCTNLRMTEIPYVK